MVEPTHLHVLCSVSVSSSIFYQITNCCVRGICFILFWCLAAQRKGMVINMKNGTMFSDLERFKKKEFWEEHKTFRFDTLYVKQTYEVIAVFKTAVYTGSENEFKYYQFVDAAVQEQFDGYIQRAKEKAFYDTGVSAEYGDKLITLSTCEYSGQNSRLVVVAKKVTESGGSNAPSNDGATEIQS